MQNTNLFAVLLLVSFLFVACKEDPEVQLSAVDQYFADYDSPVNKWGYINTKGQTVIEKKYDDLRPFTNGLAIANYGGKWGFINTEGQTMIEHQYRAAFPFKDGLARIQNFDKKYGFIDQQGTLIIPDTFTQVFDFNSGRARVKRGENYGYIDKKGKVVIEPFYKKSGNFQNGYAVVYQFGKAALIDPSGKAIIPLEAGITKIYDIVDGIIRLKVGDSYKFTSISNISKYSETYDEATDFHDGVAAVKKDDQWMFVDKRFRKMQEFEAESVKYATDHKWIVKLKNRYGIIDETKRRITLPEYDHIFPYSEGMAPFQQGDFWGYLDIDGQIALQPSLPLAWAFEEGLARVITKGRIGYINLEMEQAFPNVYIDAHNFSEGMAHVQ